MQLGMPEPDMGWFLHAFVVCGPMVIAAMLMDLLFELNLSVIAWGLATVVFTSILIYSLAYPRLPICYYCSSLTIRGKHSLQFSLRHQFGSRREVLCEHCLREGKNKVVDSFKPRAVYVYIDGNRYLPHLDPGEPAEWSPRGWPEP